MLGGATYDVGVMVMFPLSNGLHGHGPDDRHRHGPPNDGSTPRSSFSSFFMGAFTYPLLRELGRGVVAGCRLSAAVTAWGTATRTSRASGCGALGRWESRPLAMAIIIGPRIGKFRREDGTPNPIPGHEHRHCAPRPVSSSHSGGSDFKPGIDARRGRQRQTSASALVAGETPCWRAWPDRFGAMYYMWIRYGQNPTRSMTGKRASRRSSWPLRRPAGSSIRWRPVIIGMIAGVLCALSVEFVERVLKLDDVVGAISVHGTNGIWGVISVGLFADGKEQLRRRVERRPGFQ